MFSNGFQRLYCDPALFDPFSIFHPISFQRVLPFQPEDPVVDDAALLFAEAEHLTNRNDNTWRNVIDAYLRCGLLPEEEAANLKSVIDHFDADLFDIMGLIYANAGMFICALRWYRELIAEFETRNPVLDFECESVHASVGYCLYSLGLFAEAVAWSKSCIGTQPTTDAVCEALIAYEAQLAGGMLRGIERAGSRTRYTVSAFDPDFTKQTTPRLIAAMKEVAPFQDFHIAWISQATPAFEIQPGEYPFRVERDTSNLTRHKMNLLFATCGQADALLERGYIAEAKRLLLEAATLEPKAGFIRDRIKALP